MRPFLLLFLAASALPAQTLSIYSGNGQIVLEQFLSTVPLTVLATDATGKPAPGVNVTFAVTQGQGTLEGPPTIQTDANGLAGLTFLATGVPPGTSYSAITVSATAGTSSVNFFLTTVLSRLPAGGYAAPPQGQLLAPTQGGTITGAAGSTISGAVQVLVIALSGAQAGQPVQNIGVRILPSDPGLPSGACNAPAGTVLTNAQGIATCDLVLGPITGSTQLKAHIGEAEDSPPFTLTVTPGIACTYTLSTTAQNIAAAGGSGAVGISAPTGCGWTVTSNVPWIAPGAPSGTGTGQLNYTVAANTGASRTGTLTIAGQVLTVNQAGTSGTQPLLITTSANLPYGTYKTSYSTTLAASGGSGQYVWALLGSLPPGLLFSANGSISGIPTIAGTYTFNASVTDSITGQTQSQTFTLAVLGSTGQLVITTASLPNGVVGQAYQQALASTPGCSTPFSPIPIFRLLSGPLPPGLGINQMNGAYFISGTPTTNGSYPFAVSATDACGNTASANLTIVIGSTQAVALSVSPTSLQFSVVPGNVSQPGTQILTLTGSTPLAFTAVGSTATGGNWLTITGATGTTPASITVAVSNAAQLAPGNYTGSITITSPGATNSPVIVPVSFIVGAQQNMLVVTPSTIAATLKNSGSTSQQQAITIGSGGSQIAFNVSASTADGAPWLTVSPFSGTTPNVITATLNAANLAPGNYSGTIVIASASGQQVVSVQLSVIAGSSLSVTPGSLTFSSNPFGTPTTQTLTVMSTPGTATYTASASTAGGGNWLSVSPSTGLTPANLTVAVNTTGLAAGTYTGLISLSSADPTTPVVNVPVVVVINVASSTPNIVSVTNGASFSPGAIAPGELLVIFGSQLGPGALVSGLATSLAGTQVTFDGIPAPVLYTSAGQVAAIAPFEIAGRVSSVVQVSFGGALSNTLNIRVVDTAPAIFTLGAGQGAILNQDGSVNGSGNGAAAGSVISIYATGGGQTNPPGVNGQLTGGGTLPQLLGAVRVQIGGQDATVLYAGGAPGLPAGIIQINAQIPAGTAHSAQVPVTLSVGGQASPPVFVAVQ